MSAEHKIKTSFGYGTAYEKALLFDYAGQWISRYGIKDVLEFPANNLMGENNEIFEKILGKENCKKSGKNKNAERKYDLVWCFCEFEMENDSKDFIDKMFERSNRYALIITQNYKNLGVPLHFLWHILWRRKWDHGLIGKSSHNSVIKYVDDRYEIIESGAFDCPWFYFDIYETFSDIKRLLKIEGQKEQEFRITESFFEKLPLSIRMMICHHNYLIIKK